VKIAVEGIFCKDCGQAPCLLLGTVVDRTPAPSWHMPAKDDETMTACGLPMPVQVKDSKIPLCGSCMGQRMDRDLPPPRQHAREIYGDPKLRRKKSG
jgi:hypothetical protein